MEWPAFTTEEKMVMVIDEPWHIESDPQRGLREALGV